MPSLPDEIPSRYSLDRCVLEIAAMRDRLGLQDKDIWMELGIDQGQFSRKMANAGQSRFRVDELGAIADLFARLTGRLLPGWPFVSERECAWMERGVPGAANRPGDGGSV